MTTDSDPASTQSSGATTSIASSCPLEEALRILSNLNQESTRLKTQLSLLEQEISIKRSRAAQFDNIVVMGEHLEWLEEQNMDLKEDVKRLQSKLARFQSERADENAPMNRPPLRQLDFGQGSSRID